MYCPVLCLIAYCKTYSALRIKRDNDTKKRRRGSGGPNDSIMFSWLVTHPVPNPAHQGIT